MKHFLLVVLSVVALLTTAHAQTANITATSTLAAQAVCADRGQQLFSHEKPTLNREAWGDPVVDDYVTHYDAKQDRCYYERSTSTGLAVVIELKDAFAGTKLGGYSCFTTYDKPNDLSTMRTCLPNPLHEFLPDADVYCHVEGSEERGWKDSDCKSGHTFESRVQAIYGLKR